MNSPGRMRSGPGLLVLSSLGMLGLLATASGCGTGGPSLPTIPAINGKVLLSSGKPIPGGKLVLCPTPGLRPSGRRLSADLGNDGSFLIEGSEEKAIVAGKYKVFVVVSGNPKLRALKKRIPEKYQSISEDDSDLFVELEDSGKELVVKLAKS